MLPIDPLRLIPMVSNLVVGIIKLAHKIHLKVEDVKANRRQCTTLSVRIDRVVAHLNSPGFQKAIQSYGGALLQTLEDFYAFLDGCCDYISIFDDMSWLSEFIHSRAYKEQFSYYNEELNSFASELIMGINIKMFSRKQQDEEDQKQDINDILTSRSDQRKMLNDQQIKKRREQHLFFQQRNQQTGRRSRRRTNNVEYLKPIYEPRSQSRSRSKSRGRSPLPIKDTGGGYGRPSNHIFINGIWELRYSQFGVVNGPFKQRMIFHSSNHTIEGKGENNVGQFTLNGAFSTDTNQISITQTYKLGTGNPKLNAGHQCHYQTTWNKEKRIFEGQNLMPNSGMMTLVGQIEMALYHAD